MKNIKPSICYLCGEKLDYSQKNEINDDHVPPRQFYASKIRKKFNVNLFTLKVHERCNKSYQLDEDYFLHSLAPIAMDNAIGKELSYDLKRNIRRSDGKGRGLAFKVFEEFIKRPSGLVLPAGKILKRFDAQRVYRIIWKILRGLYFKEYGSYLPIETNYGIKVLDPTQQPPEEFFLVSDAPPKGDYPKVFDYKYTVIDQYGFDFHFWAFLLWDKLIVEIFFSPNSDLEDEFNKLMLED